MQLGSPTFHSGTLHQTQLTYACWTRQILCPESCISHCDLFASRLFTLAFCFIDLLLCFLLGLFLLLCFLFGHLWHLLCFLLFFACVVPGARAGIIGIVRCNIGFIYSREEHKREDLESVSHPVLLSVFEAVSTSIGRGAARPSSISTYMCTGTRQLTFVVCKKVGFASTLFLLQRWFGVFHFYGQRTQSHCPPSVSTCMCTGDCQLTFVICNRLGFAGGMFLL